MPKTMMSTTSTRPSRQLIQMPTGSSTMSETMAAQSSRKKESHMPQSVSVPWSMFFSRRPEWVSPWKERGSWSTCSKYFGEHAEPPPVGEPVRMERDSTPATMLNRPKATQPPSNGVSVS